MTVFEQELMVLTSLLTIMQVELDYSSYCLAYIQFKNRHHIPIIKPGDHVKVEFKHGVFIKGRITRRMRKM